MKLILDGFVKLAEKLPGFGIAFIVATVAHMYLKKNYTELSTGETLVTAVICWLLYYAAKVLDYLYDGAYGPKNAGGGVRREQLRRARDNASRALFGPVDANVTDYASAVRRKHVIERSKEQSLYTKCKKVSEHSDAWRKSIEPQVDASKAARTVVAFCIAGLVIPQISLARTSSIVRPYAESLRQPMALLALLGFALAALFVSIGLRFRHHLKLYEHVTKNVQHLPFGENAAAVIYDVIVEQQPTSRDTTEIVHA